MKNIGIKAILLVAVIVSFISCSSRFDINKEGGVRITTEVSAEHLIKNLSNDTQNPVFLQAMEMAKQRQRMSDKDFITLFGEAFQETDPNALLAPVFLLEFKDKGLNINSSNDEVLYLLRKEYDEAVDRSYQILATRLEQFSEERSTFFNRFKYNIRKAETPGRIIVELKGGEVDDYYRLRKLLEVQGNLELWETYKYDEIKPYLDEANASLAETHKTYYFDDLDESEDIEEAQQFKQNNPLFTVLLHNSNSNSARIGYAQLKDTANINNMLAEAKNHFPRNLKFAWVVTPTVNPYEEACYELVALKAGHDNKCALNGEVITDVRMEHNQYVGEEIAIRLNPEGTLTWKRITGENIDKQIAIVLDGYVFSDPCVNCEIPVGRFTIFNPDLTANEVEDIINILRSGMMPAPARILEETLVEPNKSK